MEKKQNFYHLHVHTEYSLLDGAIRLNELFARCKEYGMDAVAMTDHGTMFGAMEFYEKAYKAGIKPVVGCEVYVAPRSLEDKTSEDHKGMRHLVLLAKDREGYANLCKMVSVAQLKGFYYKPRIDKELLAAHCSGLIGLSACMKGEIPQLIIGRKMEEAEKALEFYLKLFGEGNFFLEVQENGIPLQSRVNEGVLDLSSRFSVPVVATNDCHYLSHGDDKAHEVLLCIQTGDTLDNAGRFKFDSDQLYFKSPDEMFACFGHIPGAIENTCEIANRCNLEFDKKSYHFPVYDLNAPDSEGEIFREKALEGFEQRFAKIKASNPDVDERLYRDRLDYEIDLILKMGFPGYFLIVADFIEYAKNNGVPVGPGRGSAAGSMVAFSMGITALDPVEHGLIFERFLNPARISMPDIDVDFCIDGRDKVYQYVTERYGGADYVSQIITFGKLKAKAVIRDVGRVMGVPLSEVDEIAKMIPDKAGSLAKAIAEVPVIQDKCSETEDKKQMLEISLLLEGLPRHASTHAAGVVIADKPLYEYLPLYKGKEGEVLTQFDMNYVEKLGLVKFDFLGLRNLTVIKNCMALIKHQGKTPPDLENPDLEDAKTFELLQKADTTGVFQLESSGMKELIMRLQPGFFSDIVALVALYRPGPLDSGMADSYVRRKHGQEPVVYLFDELEPILKETYGVILYQEQVMKIAGVLANYSMADADGLRKAMGKKIASMMEEHRGLFLKGAKENNHDLKKAAELFDLMEKFGGYGFNKSHSAAYALIAYQTAYLKANFPLEFIAALMSSEKGNSDAVLKYMEQCREHDIDVLPPDINKSFAGFTVEGEAIRFGLTAVKNIGEAVIELIVEQRQKDGDFENIYDFCERVNVSKANKKVLEQLIKCGAFDFSKDKRSQMMCIMEEAVDHGARVQREKDDDQMDLFADPGIDAAPPVSTTPMPKIEEWDNTTKLAYEKEALGFYISGHPMDGFNFLIKQYTSDNTISIKEAADGNPVRMAGTLRLLKTMKTRKNAMMAFTVLEDRSGTVEMVVFSPPYEEACQFFNGEDVVIAEARTQVKDNVVKLKAERIYPIEQTPELCTESILIKLKKEKASETTLEQLKSLFEKHPGQCPTFMKIELDNGETVMLKLGDGFKVEAGAGFFDGIRGVAGKDGVEVRCLAIKVNGNGKRKWGSG